MTLQMSSIVRQNEGILCTTITLFNSCLLCYMSDLKFNICLCRNKRNERKKH